MIATMHLWPAAVFACNEARTMIACLDNLQAAPHPLECHVLANACTDRTEARMHEYSVPRPDVHLVSITLGDTRPRLRISSCT